MLATFPSSAELQGYSDSPLSLFCCNSTLGCDGEQSALAAATRISFHVSVVLDLFSSYTWGCLNSTDNMREKSKTDK